MAPTPKLSKIHNSIYKIVFAMKVNKKVITFTLVIKMKCVYLERGNSKQTI